MKKLYEGINHSFDQLTYSINQLTPEQYSKPCKILHESSIGQHVRHIIELFQCLEKGYESGLVNYEKRERDRNIETQSKLANSLLNEIVSNMDRLDKPLLLETFFDDISQEPFFIQTNYYRELAYNLEHTIHHMALIRVGVEEVSQIRLRDDFGVAFATIKYRKQCAQ